MKGVDIIIYSRETNDISEEINILCELQNNSGKDLYLLIPESPFESTVTDSFEVKKGTKPIQYDGFLPKRAEYSIDDLRLIRNGESFFSNKIAINRLYNISSTGSYTVTVKKDKIVVLEDPAQLMNFLNKKRKQQAIKTSNEIAKLKVIATGKKLTLTIGEAIRRSEKKNRALPSVSLAIVQEPIFVGGTASQQNDTLMAHRAGYQMIVDSLSTLTSPNDSQYRDWFGAADDVRFAKVRQNYTAMKSRMDRQIFAYNLTGVGCASNWYAYTTKGGSTIWMCSLFWSAPSTGTNSKAGTIVHEHSHASAYTDDIRYGQSQCRLLAINSPNQAILNADNYEYYSGG